MLLINNSQRTVRINKTKLKRDGKKILRVLEYARFSVGVRITTNQTIRAYNARYRNKDKATDILSFPFYNISPGRVLVVSDPEARYLGDLVISAERVLKDSLQLEVPFDEWLSRLLVHGICHLVGYDHETEADYAVMVKKERELCAVLKLKNVKNF